MAILQALTDLIGSPPVNCDIIVWVCCVFVLLFLLSNVFAILGSVFRFISGRG